MISSPTPFLMVARRRATLSLTALMLSAVAMMAAEALEFSGYLTSGGQTRFILKNLETGKVGWLVKGQSFQNLTLTEFDPKTESLTLTSPAGVVQLRLKDSKVSDREAGLTAALADEEKRRASGERNEDQLFLTRVALSTLRRDMAGAADEKIKQQQLIVAAFEERQAWIENRRKIGIATDFDALTRSGDLLRAKWILSELKTTGKVPPDRTPP